MSNPLWKRFPTLPGLHCIEMKDRVQGNVMDETRELTPTALIAYFRDASQRFRREVGRAYPECAPTPMTVRGSDQFQKRS